MKINILATGRGPDFYKFEGEVVTVSQNGMSKEYDLSEFPEGGQITKVSMFEGIVPIRDVKRVNGELHVLLCQQVGPGHWRESGYMQSDDYDPNEVHTKYLPLFHHGKPWAKTKAGLKSPKGVLLG